MQLKATEAPSRIDQDVQQLAEMFPDADPGFLRTLLETQPPPALENAAKQLLASQQYPQRRQISTPEVSRDQRVSASAQRQADPVSHGIGGGGGLFSKLRKQFAGESTSRPPQSHAPAPPPPGLSRDPVTTSERPSGMVPSQPGATPTPTAAVRANLARAIQVRQLDNHVVPCRGLTMPSPRRPRDPKLRRASTMLSRRQR